MSRLTATIVVFVVLAIGLSFCALVVHIISPPVAANEDEEKKEKGG